MQDVADTSSGGTPDRIIRRLYEGGIPRVESGELSSKIITTTEESISEEGLNTSSAKMLGVGTILLTMYGATAGRVARLGIDASTNQAICAIVAREGILTEFLQVTLESKADEILSKRVGRAQPNINMGTVRRLRLKIPPVAAQRIFAARVDGVEKLAAAQRTHLAQLDILFASLQDRAFSGRL